MPARTHAPGYTYAQLQPVTDAITGFKALAALMKNTDPNVSAGRCFEVPFADTHQPLAAVPICACAPASSEPLKRPRTGRPVARGLPRADAPVPRRCPDGRLALPSRPAGPQTIQGVYRLIGYPRGQCPGVKS